MVRKNSHRSATMGSPSGLPILLDAVNCAPTRTYTQIATALLRLPSLSLRARGLLATLLSYQDEVEYPSMSVLAQTCTDDPITIPAVLQELEQVGVLLRLRYRDNATRAQYGTLWLFANAPNEFDMAAAMQALDSYELELVPTTTRGAER